MFSVQKKRKSGLFPTRWHASAPLRKGCWGIALGYAVRWCHVWGEDVLVGWTSRFLGTGVGREIEAEILAAENEATRESKQQV